MSATTLRVLEDLTPSWLTAALASAGVLDGAVVTDVAVRPVDRAVWATGGTLVRLLPTYDGPAPSAPSSVILKLPTSSESSRAQMQLIRAYRSEVRFYRDVAPTLDMRVPRCYFSDLDGETDDFVLLLEDLSHLEQADQLQGLSAERAVLSCAYIARLHARFWQRIEGLDWIPHHGESGWVSLLVAGLRAGWPQFVERFAGELPPEAVRIGERVIDALPKLMEPSPLEPVTVIHGDYRADNVFFAPPSSLDALVVVDWQTIRVGRGLYDLAHFLCESVTPTVRRACELRCLAAWHDELMRRGVSGYSLDDARSDYLHGVLIFLAISVLGAVFMDADDERAVAHLAAMVDRAFAASIDLSAEAAIPI